MKIKLSDTNGRMMIIRPDDEKEAELIQNKSQDILKFGEYIFNKSINNRSNRWWCILRRDFSILSIGVNRREIENYDENEYYKIKLNEEDIADFITLYDKIYRK